MTDSIHRRSFLRLAAAALGAATSHPVLRPLIAAQQGAPSADLPAHWINPPREFSLAPFWFWNDDLTEKEIARQLDDFCDHGVYAFVIHPRAGLPRSIGWMSDNMIRYMRFAIEQAERRKMWVILYDEGMYPSGSSSGQVVAENPAYRTRALFHIDLDEAVPGTEQAGVRIGPDGKLLLSEGQNLVATVKRKANGHRIAVIDRAVRAGSSYIRGLHFVDNDPPRRSDHREVPENKPPAADLLNSESVACFIRLTYQRFYDEFKDHFGRTVRAIFTDEPSFLAKGGERGAVPGTTRITEHVSRHLGYDFIPHLPALWYKDEPAAGRYREDYNRALQARLEETFYGQISRWCSEHNIALTGHPAAPDDIGHLRHFQMPGQDIVWRYIEPGKPSALEGAQSTQGKCASSAMIHLARRRNLNEYCGAYGHNFTFEEMKWLSWWLVVRGCNMLVPHAFYYSIRGPRIDERPPDVGPNSPWWPHYKPFADACRRLSWLNTDSKHVCNIAILGINDHLPWHAAKVCFRNQRDFNYLEARHLWEDAQVGPDGIRIAGMHYKALIVETDVPEKARKAVDVLSKAGRVIKYDRTTPDSALLHHLDKLAEPDILISPASPDIRVRHLLKNDTHYYILFNEAESTLDLKITKCAPGDKKLLCPMTSAPEPISPDQKMRFEPHEVKVLMIT